MNLGPKYTTGLIWQDFQHRQLIDLFIKVKEAKSDANSKEGKDLFKYSLAFLAMYVNHHFKLEEEYMDIYSYPETAEHKKKHKDLVKRIKEFRKTYKTDDDDAVEKLLITLNNWIRDHIIGEDKKLGDFIKSCEKKSG